AWRDSRISRIYEGTNEINRMLSVGMLLKKAMKGEVDFMSAATAVGQELMTGGIEKVSASSVLFEQEKQLIENLKKVFLMVAGAGVQKFGPKLDAEQQTLMAISDILIETYMAESALLRVEKNCARFGVESQSDQIAMVQLYLFEAIEKVNARAKEAIVSFAEGAQLTGMISGLKQYTRYAEYPNVAELRKTIAAKIIEENKYPF
ncbi:MAG: acyl-CoA dehydrogenase, partial [Flavobacteriaceae bacterium]